MTTDTEVARAIGKLEACVSGLTAKMDKVEGKVDRLCSTVDQAKGGWKVGVALASGGGVVGAALTKIASMILVVPR